MVKWLDEAKWLDEMDGPSRQILSGLKPLHVPQKTVLFSPGEQPKGFVVVLHGRIGVHLVGRSGRELLLYQVGPGETCVQTTLGMMGSQPYTAEAVAETDLVAVIIPLAMFETLMASSVAFRSFVFRAFATRVSDVMFVLEQVAFVRIEQRLASALLERADADGHVAQTHHDLAIAIGSAREVVSRQLRAFASRNLVSVERGDIVLTDREGLLALADDL